MPNDKPMGPGVLYLKEAASGGAFTQFAVTDALRHLGVPQIGDSTREKKFLQISRKNRGRNHYVWGPYNDVEFSFEIPMWGSGTAGTPVPGLRAAMEAGAGATATVSGGTSVVFALTDDNPDADLCGYYVDRLSLFGQYIIGGLVKSVTWDYNLDTPKVVISGTCAHKWSFFADTLAANMTDSATSMTLTTPEHVRTGTKATTDSSLGILVKIGDEVLKITATNYTTGVQTVERAQMGTSAAAHSAADEVTPYNEAPTYGESGDIIGPHDWAVSDGAGLDITALQVVWDTGRSHDPYESNSAGRNSFHSLPLVVNGNMKCLFKRDNWYLARQMDAGTEKALTITAGDTAGSTGTLVLAKVLFTGDIPSNPTIENPTELTINFDCIDTETALSGQATWTLI